MPNEYFKFKQFTIHQDRCAMKVTTDACLFGGFAANEIQNQIQVKNILDIGTGTGLLALMLAQKNPDISIDALEIDKEAYEQADQNIAASPWAERIRALHVDVKDFKPRSRYDVIISNPPFYENELKGDDLQKNRAHHSDGLLLKELLSVIKENLDPAGSFYLLLPYKRNNEIKNLLLKNEFAISQMIFVRQSVKHDYFRLILEGRLRSGTPAETMIREISICNKQQKYTDEFIKLLHDYYLHL